MKLYFSSTSPYVRKVLVAAHELGLSNQIEKLGSAAHPIDRDKTIIAQNPLGQVPTLILDDGTALADSRVIINYLNELTGGKLTPTDRKVRLKAEMEQAYADGILGALLLLRYETAVRPEPLRWADWIAGQWDKVSTTFAYFNANPPGERVDVGSITLAAAVSYIDLRFPDRKWRAEFPNVASWYAAFEKRPSMVATQLVG